MPSEKSKAEIILSAGSKGSQAVLWEVLRTQDMVEETKEWVQMSGEFVLPDNLSPEFELSVTPVCTGSDRVLIDDIALDLE